MKGFMSGFVVTALIAFYCSSAFAAQLDGTRFIKAGTITTLDLGADAVTAAKMGSGAATLGQVPTADGAGNVSYTNLAGTQWSRTVYTLLSGDITNQYVTFPVKCVSGSEEISITGVLGTPVSDYTLSVVGGFTQAAFVATTGFGTGSPQALVAGDVIVEKCAF